MLFDSIQYLLFLPVVTALFFGLQHRYRWLLLLLASYFFYMCWRPEYALLLLSSTVVDYWLALEMGKREHKHQRRPFLVLSIAFNLGVLSVFKYLDFFNESIRSMLELVGLSIATPRFDILLPVGISFFTFQTLGYSIDIYRGRRKPERHFGIYALYVSFFPQLVAGPVERSTRLLPQFREAKEFRLSRAVSGGKLIAWGLFKKMVIADTLVVYVDAVFDHPSEYSSLFILLTLYAFAIYIYCDLSGYTDIAIGSARILGYELMSNFNRPFFATSIPEMWRRWHISLTSWFRDYLLAPLVRSKMFRTKRHVVTYLVFALIGLWHGAGWTFVVFGLVHATMVVFYRQTATTRRRLATILGLSARPRLTKLLAIAVTFNCWAMATLAFRAESLHQCWQMIERLASFSGGWNLWPQLMQFRFSSLFVVVTAIGLLFFVELISKPDQRNPLDGLQPTIVRWAVYLGVVFYLLAFDPHHARDFYYFRF